MGLGKFLKKAVSIAAPVAGTLLAPGIGTALGSTLSSAALSGIGGAIGGGLGAEIGGGNVLKGAALGGTGGYVYGSGGLSNAWGNAENALMGSTSSGGLLTQGGLGAGGSAIDLSSLSSPLSVSGGGYGMLSNLGGMSNGISTGGLLSNLYSGYSGLNALSSAKKAQTNALSPYASTGVSANAQLAKMLGLDEDADEEEIQRTLEATPGYKFQQQQGEQALNRSLGAKGKVFSGEALKEASAYNSGLASQYYKDYLNQLQNQSGQGLLASGALGDVGANYAMGKYGLLSNVASNILNPVRYY